MLKQSGVSTNKIYQEVFLKVAVLNHSTKGATIRSFGRHAAHSLLLAESKQE